MRTMTRPQYVDNPAAYADRRDQFLRYGFTLDQADQLAAARDGLYPLHHLKVKRALDAGATHDVALGIFS